MKRLIVLSLFCCLVLAMSTPVAADWGFEFCNATEFTNCFIDYCNNNDVHEMKVGEFVDADGYDLHITTVYEGERSAIYGFVVRGYCYVFPFFAAPYEFCGKLTIDEPRFWLPPVKELSTHWTSFEARGAWWTLEVHSLRKTHFYP